MNSRILIGIAFKSKRVITIAGKKGKKQRNYNKIKQRRSRVITSQGAIEKSSKLLLKYWKK